MRLARYAGGVWRRRSLRGQAARARQELGQHLFENGGGDPELRGQLQALDEQVRAAEAAKKSTRALKSQRRVLLDRLAARNLAEVVLPAGLETEARKAKEAELAVGGQEEHLKQARATLPPSNVAGWCRVAAGYAALLGLCAITLAVGIGKGKRPHRAPNAGDAEAIAALAGMDSALKMVPADAAFCSSWQRNREQVEAVANSRAWSRLLSLPVVKSLWENAEAQHGGLVAQFREFYRKPENRELIEFLLAICSDEIFIYGGEDSLAFMDLTQQAYGATRYGPAFLKLTGKDQGLDPNALQLLMLYQTLRDNPNLLRAPDLVIGFKTTKKELAEKQLQRLEREYDSLVEQDPRWKGRLTRNTEGGQESWTLTLDGKLIPWEKLPFHTFEEKPGESRELVRKLSQMKLTITAVLRDGYLLVGLGESTAHLARFGQGKRLIENPDLRPLARYADRPLTSVHYVSKAMNTRLSAGKQDVKEVARLAKTSLNEARLAPEARRRLEADIDKLSQELQPLIPEPGATLSFSFRTERGLESYRHDWGEPGMLDGSRPLTLLNHAGGSPLLLVAGRSKSPLEQYQLLARWLRVGWTYVDELLVPQLQGPEREQYQQFVKEILPLVKRFDEVTSQLLLPALADGQAALVIDSKLTSRQWFQEAPPAEQPLPLPEPALVVGVSDAALLGKAMAEYRVLVNDLLASGQRLAPGQLPDVNIPAPQTRKTDDGDLHAFTLPAELGVDPKVAPTAGLSDRVGVLTLNPGHAKRLLKSTPLAADSRPLADTTRPLATATYLDWAGLVDVVGPWVQFFMKSANPELGQGPNADEILKQVRSGLDLLKVLRSYSSCTYLQDGATVTHSEIVIRDLK